MADATAARQLLALLSPACSVDFELVARMRPDDWNALLAVARQHRLMPLLRWRLRQAYPAFTPPAPVAEQLEKASERATQRVLAQQAEWVRLYRALDAAGIRAVALKGAWLALRAYPHPALRPMRDLDLWIPREQAARAYDTLLALGYTRVDGVPASQGVQAELSLGVKHLPPLRAPHGPTVVELHLSMSNEPQRDAHLAPWARSTDGGPDVSVDSTEGHRVAGVEMRFPRPEDLLLHLVVHAVYDHGFDNGPLLLSDIGFLLMQGPLDWPAVWQRAEAMGAARALQLVLVLTERRWGPLPSGALTLAPAPPEEPWPMEQVEALMLQAAQVRPTVRLVSEITDRLRAGSLWPWLKPRLLPSSAQLTARYGQRHGARDWLRQLLRFYLGHVGVRGIDAVRSVGGRHDRSLVGAHRHLRHWLQSPPGS